MNPTLNAAAVPLQPAPQALRWNTLRASGVVPHYFGLGFIQLKLNDRERVHVWVPDWPIIPGAESEWHDHRYAFESTVLAGALTHECATLATDDAQDSPWEWVEVNCQPGQAQAPVVRGRVRLVPLTTFTVRAPDTYRLEPEALHRATPQGPTVTLVRRSPQVKALARVVRPVNAAWACPFEVNPGAEACWERLASMWEALGWK